MPRGVANPLPPVERWRELFIYSPVAGNLSWREDRGSSGPWGKAGQVAGSYGGKRYITVKIDGVNYTAHRIIWKLMTGSDPVDQIDHKNRDRQDNRWENLRAATSSENSRNVVQKKKRGSRFRGVCHQSPRAWTATIGHNGRYRYLGSFSDEIDAALAYDAAARELHGEFAVLNFPALEEAA